MIDKEKLKRRFSRNAKTYDKYANVQKYMADVLVESVHSKSLQCKNILEIGCGTGYVTNKLVTMYPEANIVAVDLAPGMIEQAKAFVSSDQVEFVIGDVESMEFDEKFDLIISNATFQWFNDFDQTVGKLLRQLTPNGLLCFSTFGENTFCELSEAFLKASSVLAIPEKVKPSQNFYSLGELQDRCKEISENLGELQLQINSEEAYFPEYFSSCTEFLFSIKKIGANNSDSDRKVMPPGFIDKVIEIYDEDYRDKDQIVATYHSLFFYIQKRTDHVI